MTIPTSNLVQQAAAIIETAQQMVVLTGAGISKESGIPTFREAQDGLWAQYDPERLATMQGFLSNPRLVWEWYQSRLTKVRHCEPNPGHRAIADLERLLPGVVVVTQNIDSLHARAGSNDVIELHGNIGRFKCLHGHLNLSMDDLADQATIPPLCPHPKCDAMVRPDVVWFGEMLDDAVINRAFEESEACDVMLIVGTSGVVTPAANLPYYAKQSGAVIVEVNPVPSALTHLADVFLAGPAGEMLPNVVAKLSEK
ncbi:MAG: NAD-dependent deacylase [Chloroflexota bacterium]|nr:NAD-dependent deacylase [Chloroflexota bacterium]